jgi:hypothetical protein
LGKPHHFNVWQLFRLQSYRSRIEIHLILNNGSESEVIGGVPGRLRAQFASHAQDRMGVFRGLIDGYVSHVMFRLDFLSSECLFNGKKRIEVLCTQ